MLEDPFPGDDACARPVVDQPESRCGCTRARRIHLAWLHTQFGGSRRAAHTEVGIDETEGVSAVVEAEMAYFGFGLKTPALLV